MYDRSTKERVIHAAIQLFFQKGFDATSTRDITNKVRVNSSLISYYFNGKQGLLEEVVVSYYEELIVCIEEAMTKNFDTGIEHLKHVLNEVFLFKYENFYQTVVVYRELTLDSTFVREMLTTYIQKENYYLRKIFAKSIEHSAHIEKNISMWILQLKGMMNAPFTMHHEWTKDAFSQKVDRQLCLKYISQMHAWIDLLHETKDTVQVSR